MLILGQLIVVIGYLKPAPRGKQVQVEGVATVGLQVDAIENGLVVPLVVKGSELWSVQKAPSPQAIDGEEVAKLRRAEAEADASSG